MNIKKQRFAAMLACLAIVMVAFFSVFFVAKETNHHCVGQECPICVSILEAQEAIRNIGSAVISIVVSMFMPAVIILACLVLVQVFFADHSLISQKVRLDN